MSRNPTANHLRGFLINEIKMDLDIVNLSFKELGEKELNNDNLVRISSIKEDICKKLIELDDYLYSIK